MQMSAKLYNVYTNNEGEDKPSLIMTAPMATLIQVFDLHKDAVRRIEYEMGQPGGISVMHFNGRGRLPWKSVVIQSV